MKRLLLIAFFLLPQTARPDAIVVTKAMTATTIAEIYITEEMVRVELEIGAGDVGHWGHIHRRRNQYDATVTVAAVEGSWKIRDLTLLEEKRL